MKLALDLHLQLGWELAAFLWCQQLRLGPVHELLLKQGRLVVLGQPAKYRPVGTALSLSVGGRTHKDTQGEGEDVI